MNTARIDKIKREAAQDAGRLRRVYTITVDAVTGAVERADGSWEFDGVATRGDAVFDYSNEAGIEWREYRPLDEVFAADSIASLAGCALTDDHPQDFVDIYNARDLSRGTVLRAWQDDALMRVRVVVRDAELIAKIQAGKVELSCGYTAVVVPGNGVHAVEGAYQATQTKIVHNHLAVVDAARAGPVARLAVPPTTAAPAAPGTDGRRPDRAGSPTPTNNKDASMQKIMINGVEFEVDPAVAEAYTALNTELTAKSAQITELQQKLAGAQTPAPAPDPAAAAAAAQAAGAAPTGDAKGDKAPLTKADLARELDLRDAAARKAADQRASVVADAAKLLPTNYDYTGKSDAQIAADAIVAVDKDYKATADSYVKAGNVDALAAVLKVRASDAAKSNVLDFGHLIAKTADGKPAPGADDHRQAMIDRKNGKRPAAGGGK